MNPVANNEVGLVVASEHLLGRSDRAGIILRVAVAYSAGVRLAISAVTKVDNDPHWHDDVVGAGPDGVLFGAAWEGEALPRDHPAMRAIALPEQATELAWMPLIAGGGGNHYDVTLWLSPLRTEGGKITLTFSWTRLAIAAFSYALGTPTQRELRRRVLRLWS